MSERPMEREIGAPELKAVMWEDELAQIVNLETVNEVFVQRALAAHATIVLLETELRPGTRGEIEALIEVPADRRPPLFVVVFEPADGRAVTQDVLDLLRVIGGDEHKVIYKRTDTIGSPESMALMSQIVLDCALRATKTSREKARKGPDDVT